MIVYKATNLCNGKVYIGQTVNSLEYRADQHMRETRSLKRKNTYFHNAISKYGEQNFIFEVIDTADSIDELNEKEQYWINYYDSTSKENGYNLDSGGSNCLKSESTKMKISAVKKELWQNPDVAERMRAGLAKGVETMKLRKGWRDVTITCSNCGASITLPMYEAKHRQYCSQKCANEVNLKKGTKAAAESTMQKHREVSRLITYDIIDWIRDNEYTVINCPQNNISGYFEPMRAMIERRYGIKDLRSIFACATGSYSKKLFLDWAKKQL